MASEPVRSTKVVAAPKDYSIPLAQQIQLLSVRAQFLDNGAGGAWLPALQILDNNGNVLVTAADKAVSVTAGSNADVSWFPGVKPQAASAVTSSGVPFMTYFTHSTTITVQSALTFMDGQTFSPDVPGIMKQDTTVIGGITYHGVSQLAAGVYLVMAQASGGGTTTGDLIQFDPEHGGGSALSGWVQGNDTFLSQALGAGGTIVNYLAYLSEVDTPPTTAEIFALMNSSHASGHAVAQIAYFYLGAGTI